MKKRNSLTLCCSICNSRNYNIKMPSNHKNKLILNKYCPKCNKQTMHEETI